MRIPLLVPIALTASALRLDAQSIWDFGARVAPQYYSYTIAAPSNTKIRELAVPMFAYVPITPALTVDVGTSYASAHVEKTVDNKTTTSNISGLTDTQVRASYTIGTDFVVITGGVNLPTGRSTVTAEQRLAAGLIGSDFLALPIAQMGTGLGTTAGVAVARPTGDWNLGLGLSLRHSAQYEPFDAGGAAPFRYQPGNEYRARVGVDHPFGTGRITAGVTYSTFGNDNLAGSIYNTGDRYLSQVGLVNTYGVGDLSVVGWNLFRTAGTLADSSVLGRENISNLLVGYELTTLGTRVEPTAEVRHWLQTGAPSSTLVNLGVKAQLTVASFGVTPSVGYTFGRLASETEGIAVRAGLTGFRGMLTVRLR